MNRISDLNGIIGTLQKEKEALRVEAAEQRVSISEVPFPLELPTGKIIITQKQKLMAAVLGISR